MIVLGEEDVPAYDRVALSSYVGSWDVRELALSGNDFDGDGAVDLRVGVRAESIDPDARTVTTSTGEVLHYDALVLATGSYPFVPPVPGHDHDLCFVYRTPTDLDGIRARARRPDRVRSVSWSAAGYWGSRPRNALRQLGMTPHVVEHNARLMPLQVDEGGGAVLARLVTDLGLALHTGTGIASITDGPAGVRVELSDGTVIDAALLVFSAGIRPPRPAGPRRRARRRRAGRHPHRQRFASPPIPRCSRSVSARPSRAAATGWSRPDTPPPRWSRNRLLGGDAVFPGADLSTKLKLLGVDVASFGDVHAATPGALEWCCSATPRRAPTPSSWSPTTRGLCSAASSSATRARTDRCVRSSDGSCPANPRH